MDTPLSEDGVTNLPDEYSQGLINVILSTCTNCFLKLSH